MNIKMNDQWKINNLCTISCYAEYNQDKIGINISDCNIFHSFLNKKQLQVSHWNRCFQIIIASNMNKVAKRPCRGVSLTYNYTRAHRHTHIHTNTQNQTRWYTHLVSRFPIGLCLIHYLEGTMSLKVEVERLVYCMLK